MKSERLHRREQEHIPDGIGPGKEHDAAVNADAEAARAAAEAARDAAEDVRDAAIAKVEAAVDEAVTELRDGKYDLAGPAKNLVGKHNEEAVAHPDLRLEVQGVRSTAQAAERVAQQTAQAAAVERLQQMERRNADTARLLFSREKKVTKKEL